MITIRHPSTDNGDLMHPEWSRNASIYQVNLRQFSPEGTITAAMAQLARIRDLGIKLVWLMPIHQIGLKNRKGSLGSPYAVRDYYSVNEELGTLDDLKAFVSKAHDLGMYVILDWVANHTSWDNVLVNEHPEWYQRNWKGDFQSTPWYDWDDVINLDYSSAELREWMIEALSYWVREADIDGYRCDVAGYVPTVFWEDARRNLDRIKPVFMLAESEERDLHHTAFDMTYSWSWHNVMSKIAKGESNVQALRGYYASHTAAFPRDGYRMLFVTNHDINAWHGTEVEMFGDALDSVIALSVVSEGMPLIYGGQEANNTRQLAFFDRDPIEWRQHVYADFYRELITLKATNSALWNGAAGAPMIEVPNSAPDRVLSFVRQNESHKVLAIFNLSQETVSFSLGDTLCHGVYTAFGSETEYQVDESKEWTMSPWDYLILV